MAKQEKAEFKVELQLIRFTAEHLQCSIMAKLEKF
jgi:hypothetical protein